MSDQNAAATTQGGETLPAKVTLYPQERTLNIPAAPLAVGVTAGCPVTAAAPVETNKPLTHCQKCGYEERDTRHSDPLHHDLHAFAAAAPVEEGREGEACANCGKAFGPSYNRVVVHEGGKLYCSARCASRAPHEGPTSGLREVELRAAFAAGVDYACQPRECPFVHADSGFEPWFEKLAASPLAPTSGLREAAERADLRWQLARAKSASAGEPPGTRTAALNLVCGPTTGCGRSFDASLATCPHCGRGNATRYVSAAPAGEPDTGLRESTEFSLSLAHDHVAAVVKRHEPDAGEITDNLDAIVGLLTNYAEDVEGSEEEVHAVRARQWLIDYVASRRAASRPVVENTGETT